MKKIAIIFAMLINIAYAQVKPPMPNTYVNDLAGVLDNGKIELLNQQLRALETKYSVQMAVVLLSDLPDGYDVERYAIEVGRTWHVGNAKNGLVYVAAINQRKQRLEVANNLQGTISDVDASRLTDVVKPFFRSKDYYGGLSKLITEIDIKLTPAQAEQQTLASNELKKKEEKEDSSLLWILLIPITALVAFFAIRRGLKAKKDRDRAIAELDNDDTHLRGAFMPPITPRVTASYSRPRRSYSDDTPIIVAPSYPSSSSYDSGSSSSSSSDSNSSSSYGDWGSGSSGSSDSGFSGGGSSSDW